MSEPLLKVDNLKRHYRAPRESLFRPAGVVPALDGVSFSIVAGKSFGIVGESGSGKSTLGRVVLALEPPTAGTVRFLGRDLNALSAQALRRAREDMQMVFQDPYGSLDPRQKTGRIVAEPLAALRRASLAEQRERVAAALAAVGLRASDMDKYPHEFSGGQRQRIAIARALVTRPKLIVADEPVSALDVSVQAQVLNLLRDLEAEYGVTYILISHDLAVVDYICENVAVMYRGRVVEEGPSREILTSPGHPYTQALLAAIPRPIPGRRRRALIRSRPADVAATGNQAGCPYAARCPFVEAVCRAETPPLRPIAPGHQAACHFAPVSNDALASSA